MNKFKAFLKDNKLTQVKVAAALGVSQQVVQRWSARGYVSLSRAFEIQDLYCYDAIRLIKDADILTLQRILRLNDKV